MQNEIFNLGFGQATTLKEVLDLLYEYFPSAPKPQLETNLLYSNKEYKGLYLDIGKIKSKINWSPQYTIKDGLKEMLEKQTVLSISNKSM